MSVVTTTVAPETLTLNEARLRVPALGPESLPIKQIEPAPCTQACPAGINVKAYVSLIAERRFAEALEVVRKHCPLPGVCGRVCDRPCETACHRGHFDDPISIRALKRFAADVASPLVGDERLATAPPTRGDATAGCPRLHLLDNRVGQSPTYPDCHACKPVPRRPWLLHFATHKG